jgi:hypothetical protein
MGRTDEKTIKDTSIQDIWVRILDAYVQQEQRKGILYGKRVSRAKVIEDAILVLLAQKGALESVLESVGVPAEEVQRTIQRLKVEYDISPKS